MVEKRMPFMNFKIVNAKNKKMEFKKLLKYSISLHWGFNHSLSHRDIKQGFWKNQGNKIKDSGEAYEFNLFTDALTWIPSGMRTLQDFCFILNSNIKFNYLQAG